MFMNKIMFTLQMLAKLNPQSRSVQSASMVMVKVRQVWRETVPVGRYVECTSSATFLHIPNLSLRSKTLFESGKCIHAPVSTGR